MKKIALFFINLLVISMLGGIFVSPAIADTNPNMITNPSAETTPLSGGDPVGWMHSAWGTNTPSYAVISPGQDGTKGLFTTISAYTNGDAKWYFTPVTVTPGTKLVFSDYYKSTLSTDIVARYVDASGNETFQWLGAAGPSSAWTQISYNVVVPSGVSTMTVYHTLSGVGTLQTDNYSLRLPSAITVSGGIGNSSFEQVSDTSSEMPAGWQTGSWGNNTSTYSYATSGYDGLRSAKTTISSYTSGDAKWVFDPVSVSPNTKYVYADYYMANVSTFIVAQITATDGIISYIDMGTVPASISWKRAAAVFTTPANAKTVAVFHIISAVGSLQIDLASLQPDMVLAVTNGIGNSTLEQTSLIDPTKPIGWLNGKWGTSTATFSYVATGHNATHAVKTQISSYTSGDAKWYYAEQPIAAGASYRFSDWYQSSITSSVVMQITNVDGTVSYMQLPTANAASTWTQYSTKITVPATAKSATVMHLIAGVGTLTTDDYSLLPATTVGFNRPLVSLTFDDGWGSLYSNALPLLKSHNIKSTQYVVTGFVGTPDYMTIAMINAFAANGHEIASHTVSHPNLTTVSTGQLTSELSNSQSYIAAHGWGAAKNFATPYGAYNSTVITGIKKYYTSHRSTDVGYNSKDSFDYYNLRVQDVTISTTQAQFDSWLDKAKSENTWLILVFHQIDSSGNAFSSTPAQLETYLTDINSRGLATPTVSSALSEIAPQL